MSRHCLSQCLLLSLLAVYAAFKHGSCTEHHIRPSLDRPCPQNSSSCLTLSQFAANSSHNETDLSLAFLPGNHTLELSVLRLAHGHNFSMSKYAQENETVFVKCRSHLGRFDISMTTSVSIKGLNFINCGNIRVSQVTWLTIIDSTFQDAEHKITVLALDEVVTANIVRSQFLYNALDHHNSTTSPRSSDDGLLDYVYHQRIKPSGILYTAFSNVTITSSRFIHNKADIGGALVVHNSTLYIYESAYINNTANFGGAMITSASTINIDKSIFTHNSAQDSGGVMMTFNDRLSISGTAFTQNSADKFAGVVITLGNSSIAISNSNFTSNSATEGGVLRAYDDSSFDISNSTFTLNSATYGGVMATSGDSSSNISSCTFSSNSANEGGVMRTYNGSSFTLFKISFTSNSAIRYGGVISALGHSSFNTTSSSFSSNHAIYGGVMATFDKSSLTMSNSNCTFNSATSGGVMRTSNDTMFIIRNSNFNFNSATYGGVIRAFEDSSFTICKSFFTSNSATYGGVVRTSDDTAFSISNSHFVFNSANRYGGVISTLDYSSFNITSSNFTFNSATYGGVMATYQYSSLIINNSNFTSNSATYSGVIRTHDNSSFTVSYSNFTFCSATRSGGVMSTYGYSSFTITNSKFTSNSAARDGGVIRTFDFCSFNTIKSNFTSNSANYGGVMVTSDDSSFIISNCNFNYNSALSGGVIRTYHGSVFIILISTFTSNRAVYGGVLSTSQGSLCTIDNSDFTFNSATRHGGVINTAGSSSLNMNNNTFISNSEKYGGVMATSDKSSITISNCNFAFNNAIEGGVMRMYYGSTFTIYKSNFTSNIATYGGVMRTSGDSSFTISNSYFTSNIATYGGVMRTYDNSSFIVLLSAFTSNNATTGGVMKTWRDTSFTISNSNFTSNSATFGGVIRTYDNSLFTIYECIFKDNSATYGGVMRTSKDSSFTISNSYFTSNGATNGGVMQTLGDSSFVISNSTFTSNNATYGGVMRTYDNSFFITHKNNFTSNMATHGGVVRISGNTTFTISNSNFILNKATRVGGVITCFQSKVIFSRDSTTNMLNNQASEGGAILAIESKLIMYGEITIANNNMITIANSSGGGISLNQSHLEIIGRCNLTNNSAVRGGGIRATSSTIAVYQTGTLQLINNNAKLGGGMYLELNSKLHVLKIAPNLESIYYLTFMGNNAYYGGAVYVADYTNTDSCIPDNQCFIQTFGLYPVHDEYNIDTVYMFFRNNTATEQGSNLFGGQLDRCIPNISAEIYVDKRTNYYSGVTYLQNISNIHLDSISSKPVRVCFCNYTMKPDCSYQLPTIKVKKGETFKVLAVAVDQAKNIVEADITTSISSPDSSFGEGQHTHRVERHCSELSYNLFSRHKSEKINLFANGPCGNATFSTSQVTIEFTDCTCPIGFVPLSNSQTSTNCECICDSKLSPFITNCNYTTRSVLRVGTNSWITYINDTDPPGYVKYPKCHFDYCQPLTKNISINFNLPNGADAQCAYNRTGVLCGACGGKFSLSLASSRCLPCQHHWPAVCIVILLVTIVAGILLVTALLALNVTVSIGLINGFIFYANIVSAGSTVFFPTSQLSFASVFVAWLNLEIGIDVCFIDGLDVYIKTWFQLAFPTYIIFLVVMVIILSEYSPRFARLIGKRDPVSTLATLILLSYAKLLSVTITVLSFAVLDYPDGKQEIVWLPDGNVKYFQGKHIPLALVAIFIIIIGLPYTILLFLWQWIVRAPSWKIFTWTRNTKLNAFISTYHVPQNNQYRYWTGLLLLVRVVLYVTASVTVSTNAQTLPLITGVLIGILVCIKGVFGVKTYKNTLVNTVDTTHYFNLLLLALFSLYDFKRNIAKQTAVAYTSVIITLILFIVSLCYHITLLIKKNKSSQDLNEIPYPFSPVQQASVEVTFSVIELPKRDQGPSPDKNRDVAVF